MDKVEALQQTRDKEVERVRLGKTGSLSDSFQTTVVGVSFVPHWPQNLHTLEEIWFEAEAQGEPLAAVLVRNPANAFDPNAVEVHIPSLGEQGFVGHIPRALAARLAPEIDNGTTWQGTVSGLRIHPDHLEHPGLDVRLDRKKVTNG